LWAADVLSDGSKDVTEGVCMSRDRVGVERRIELRSVPASLGF